MHRLILPALFLCVASTACRPPLDGGWNGTATCGNNAFPLDAIFNETNDAKLEGTIFIEGLFAGLIAKGTITDGSREDDGSYRGDLNTDSDAKSEFSFTFAYLDNSIDTVKGDVDQLDDNGNTTQTCSLRMDRETVND